ncbi:hypothetical protein BC835DRAFT_1412341 [Cytidiella melzeri]|nr:hypothetical protein BC835DRAFT_1412341 [Cytidiella melzeri]
MPASSSVSEPAVSNPCHYCGPQEPTCCPEKAADLAANVPCIFYNSPNLPITVLSSSLTPETQQDDKSKLESYQDSEIDYEDPPCHTIAGPHKRMRLIPLPFELYEDPNNCLIQNPPDPALLLQPCKNCEPRVYAIDPHLGCNLSTCSYGRPYDPECEVNVIEILLPHVAHLMPMWKFRVETALNTILNFYALRGGSTVPREVTGAVFNVMTGQIGDSVVAKYLNELQLHILMEKLREHFDPKTTVSDANKIFQLFHLRRPVYEMEKLLDDALNLVGKLAVKGIDIPLYIFYSAIVGIIPPPYNTTRANYKA